MKFKNKQGRLMSLFFYALQKIVPNILVLSVLFIVPSSLMGKYVEWENGFRVHVLMSPSPLANDAQGGNNGTIHNMVFLNHRHISALGANVVKMGGIMANEELSFGSPEDIYYVNVYSYDPTSLSTSGRGVLIYTMLVPSDILNSKPGVYHSQGFQKHYEVLGYETEFDSRDIMKWSENKAKVFCPDDECMKMLHPDQNKSLTWQYLNMVSKLKSKLNVDFFKARYSGTDGEAVINCLKKVSLLQPVIVELRIPDALYSKVQSRGIESIKIPGVIGEINVSSTENLKERLQAKVHYSCDFAKPLDNTNTLCGLFSAMRMPDIRKATESEDIRIVAHRGYWGNNLGSGMPENTIEAVKAGFDFNTSEKVVEMDISLTSDDRLIMAHDYAIKRLTDYEGDEFSFDMTYGELHQYYTRKRNEEVSTIKLSTFQDVLKNAITDDAILMLDAKEKQARMNGAVCVANCDYQAVEKQQESWADIIKHAIIRAGDFEKEKNLIVKTYYRPELVRKLIGHYMRYVTWTPMIVSNHPNFSNNGKPDIQKMCDFIDEWNEDWRWHVIYYETDFKMADDVQLQPFSRNGKNYDNLLHYVYEKTGRRSGIFSEDPVGPKGTVNRWGKWMHSPKWNTVSTDPFLLLTVPNGSIPYGKIMVITSDRLDVWKQIKEKF